MLAQWFQGTAVIDALIALTLAEGLALALYRHNTGRGVALRDVGLNLLAGLMLMLALRSTLAASGWGWTAAFLAASGVAHAGDLWSRWKR